jgi:hypothetical protein
LYKQEKNEKYDKADKESDNGGNVPRDSQFSHLQIEEGRDDHADKQGDDERN